MSFNIQKVESSALRACEAAGIEYKPPTVFYKHIRTRATNKKGANLAGALFYFDNSSGYVCNWSLGVEVYFFPKADHAHQTEEERAKLFAELKTRRERAEAEQKAANDKAAAIAKALMMQTRAANRFHGYLVKKHLTTFAARYLRRIPRREAVQIIGQGVVFNEEIAPQPLKGLSDSLLVVPIQNASDDVCSVQFIDENGNKRFLKGGKLSGCYWGSLLRTKEGIDPETIGICEGVATALSLFYCKKIPVVAAFSAKNLKAVGKAIRYRYPNAKIIFLADRDPTGVGELAAKDAARALGEGSTIKMPTFDRDTIERFRRLCGEQNTPTDYNDLYAALELIR